MSNEHTPLPGPIQGGDKDQEQQFSILKAFFKTDHHFFGDVSALFQSVEDPRRPELILYPLPALLFTEVLVFLCRLGARRQIAHQLRQNGPSTAKFQALFGTDTCPHGDTFDVTFGRLDPDQVQAVVTGMVRTLIRKKVLDRYRLRGWYFVIAIDVTGRFTFPERHCPHCMTVTHNGKTTYYHPVSHSPHSMRTKTVSRSSCRIPRHRVPSSRPCTGNRESRCTVICKGSIRLNVPPSCCATGMTVPRLRSLQHSISRSAR